MALKVRRVTALPVSTSNRRHKATPAIYDQGALGSCTANAIGAAFEYITRRERAVEDFTPSRLAIYYEERRIERTIESDAGAEIRDGMRVISCIGAAPESLWPYAIERFTQRPPDAYYAAAQQHICTVYERVPQTENAIKSCLAAGYPVIFGFTVYESFESAKVARSGHVPLPRTSEAALGGHAVALWDYSKTKAVCRNSWGPEWGSSGYFDLPWDYVLNPDLSSDFWTIRVVK